MRNYLLILYTVLFISCIDSTRFRLLSSKQTGSDFENTIVETDSLNILSNEFIYNVAGVGIADLNKDGLPDIILAGNQVSTRVYFNVGNFKFRDITKNFHGLTNEV